MWTDEGVAGHRVQGPNATAHHFAGAEEARQWSRTDTATSAPRPKPAATLVVSGRWGCQDRRVDRVTTPRG